jgi:hypothetical protein
MAVSVGFRSTDERPLPDANRMSPAFGPVVRNTPTVSDRPKISYPSRWPSSMTVQNGRSGRVG